jgi:hypothetical protein
VYFQSLNSIDLSFNNLIGDDLPSFLSSNSLEIIKLNNNNILLSFKQFLNWINGLKYLQQIDLSFNKFYVEDLSSVIYPQVSSLILSYNNISWTLDSFFNTFPLLSEFDISNNNIYGGLPSNIPLTLTTLNIHNTRISGTLPSTLNRIPLQSIDISNTGLCGSFPAEWNKISWLSCNLNIPYYCNSSVPYGCVTSGCDESTMCFVDQCKTGIDKCKNGRYCISNMNKWSYTCTDCNEYIYFNDGSYHCKAGYVIILGPIILVVIIFIIAVLCYLNKQKNKRRHPDASPLLSPVTED